MVGYLFMAAGVLQERGTVKGTGRLRITLPIFLAALAFAGFAGQASAAPPASGRHAFSGTPLRDSHISCRATSEDELAADMDDEDVDGGEVTPLLESSLHALVQHCAEAGRASFDRAPAGRLTEPHALPTHGRALRRRIFKKSW